MAEPSVQVPMVLAQQMRGHFRARTDAFSRQKAEQLDALLSQPTPSVESTSLTGRLAELREPVNGDRPYCLSNQPGDGACNCDMAMPPRIEDMAPGTTFVAPLRDGGSGDRWWMVTEHGLASSDGAAGISARVIDPSTIRNIQPPKEPTA